MAANRDNSLEGQLTHVIQHHISQPGAEAQVSVHQVHGPGSGKRHQIIIDIKQDIDIDETSTRSLAESVMETLGARSAAVYIDNNQQTVGADSELESLTTVNVIVANDLSQAVAPASPSPVVIEDNSMEEIQDQGESSGSEGRLTIDQVVEMSNAANSPNGDSAVLTISTSSTNTATASGTI